MSYKNLLRSLKHRAVIKRVDRQGFDAKLFEDAASAIEQLTLDKVSLLGPPRPKEKKA